MKLLNYIKISKKARTIAVALALFIVITLAYFSPLLEGKRMMGSDTLHYTGMAKEIHDYRDNEGKTALWTNTLFSGMPAYLISVPYPGNLFAPVLKALEIIPRPAIDIIKNFSFFFFLMMLFKVNVWVCFAGALAYSFSTTYFVWLDTGHMTKADTLTYMALLIAGILYAYKKNKLIGSVLASLGLAFMLNANHPQITYYAGILSAIIGIVYLIFAIKEKTLPKFVKTSALLILAAILAIGVNFGKLYNIYEYGKYSMRGESELTPTDENRTSGLDRDYILDYSYDIGEAFTAYIPRFKGGGMAEPLGENSNFYKALAGSQGATRARQMAKQAPLYWGSQPISGAPFYFGAVLIFLFVFGLFVVKGKDKWWVVAAVIISFLLSLGKNIPALAHFMIDYFPMYDKFRDVKNIIVIQHFSMAFLGIMAVKTVYQRTISDAEFYKKLKIAFGIAGGFALLFALMPSLAGNFSGNSDARYLQMGWPEQFIDALREDRKAVLRADAFRTFVFVALTAAALWAFWAKKIKAQVALVLWVVLILADMWPINKRYLNNDDFMPKRRVEVPFAPSAADTEILKDTDINYRVLNVSVSTFNDAITSYFHKSVGGYHGAKMQRYQEFIEQHLSQEMQRLFSRLQSIQSEDDLDLLFSGLNGLNMLNTKYIIYNPDAPPLFNEHVLGNAWFVNRVEMVNSADEEIARIDKVNIYETAIIDSKHKHLLPERIEPDQRASIMLDSYAPNKLVYRSESAKEQIAVFSEIYYPKGWIAKINGQKVPHFHVNYILRGLVIPAGSNEIIFTFEPRSYKVGNTVSLISSILLFIAIAAIILYEYRKRKKLTENAE